MYFCFPHHINIRPLPNTQTCNTQTRPIPLKTPKTLICHLSFVICHLSFVICHFRLSTSFFLPFKTTFETESFSVQAQEKVFQKSINPSGKHFLYLKYSQATTEVLSLVVWYRVRRQIQLDYNRY